MMKKNQFKSILVFFLMMFAWEALGQNTTRVYIDDFTIEPGESKELKVKFEGNVYITQVQFVITLPAGLEFENKGTARRPVYVTNTPNSSGLAPSANLIETDNQLRVFLSDGEQIGTEEQSGDLAIVYVKAKSDIAGGEYIATLTEVEASDESASAYRTANQNIKITVPKQTVSYTINIQSGNSSYGTVSVSPNGNGSYEEGSVVTATATPKSGYHFVKWSDGTTTNPYRITVKGNVSLTAEFAAESTSNITFKDAVVKQICVQNWDTNSDGEISEAEAAAVKDLGTVFYRNTRITSFDELRYFTNLVEIWNSAFEGCSGLTSVMIANSVHSILGGAFSKCSGLTSLTIPNSVTSIEGLAFSGCNALTSLTIPNSVTSIGQQSFKGCSSLVSLTIGNSLADIGSGAFDGCSSLLTSIKVDGANKKYDSRNNCNALIETTSNKLILGCKNTIIPNTVTSIGAGAFDECSGLTSITIPNSVTSIGNYAFQNCTGLKEVISEVNNPGAVSIGYDAFTSTPSDIVLFVPSGLLSAYKSYSQWTKWFKDIRELQSGETGIENVANTSEREKKDYFTLDGRKASRANRGLSILRMSDGSTKKVVVK